MDVKIQKEAKAAPMDMDTAWCLTCSKRTRDASTLYCSEACQAEDVSPSVTDPSSSDGPVSPPPVVSYVPPIIHLSTSPPVNATPRASSPAQAKSLFKQPPKTIPDEDTNQLELRITHTKKYRSTKSESSRLPRDRRAFSFPAHATPPIVMLDRKRHSRQSQAALPPFIRKSTVISGTLLNSPPLVPLNTPSPSHKGLKAPAQGTAVSTPGVITPLCPESVFGSTSESDVDHDHHDAAAAFSPFPKAVTLDKTKLEQRARKSSTAQADDTLRINTKKRSNLTPPHESTRNLSSRSPVSAFAASSASSRSRDDIISWAKSIGPRPGETSSEDEDADTDERGRSRTRKAPRANGSGHRSVPKRTEEVDEPTSHDEGIAGTTPKGSLSSALAGLKIGGFGVGPIVKALTSTITPVTSNTKPSTPVKSAASLPNTGNNGLGLQSLPSEARVSRVAVVTTPATTSSAPQTQAIHGQPPSVCPTDSDLPHLGATPTLSTISFSEVVDPSILDLHDHVDVINDTTDDALSTASYARNLPSSVARGFKASKSSQPVTPSPAKKPPLPLRPIANTAYAIWNWSSYLRSMAPFSLASAIAPLGPFTPEEEIRSPSMKPTTSTTANALAQNDLASPPVALPASRGASPDQPIEAPTQIVRSLPMDIVIPPSREALAANDDRMREREVREWLDRSRSRRRTRSRRSRSRSRSRDRDQSRGRRERGDSQSRGRRSKTRQSPTSSERGRSSNGTKLEAVEDKKPGRVDRGFDTPMMSEDEDDASHPVEGAEGKGHSRVISYDADESGNEGAPRRGRSRRGKVLA